jgi:lipopolysaccharide export system protein LptA
MRYFLLFILNGMVFGEENPPKLQGQLTLNADELSYNDKQKKSYAKNNAVAIQKTENGEQILRAKTLVATHDQSVNAKDNTSNIKEIEATENVIFETPEYIVHADHCTYINTPKKITCDGHINFKDIKKDNSLEGNKAFLDLEKNVYHVYGSLDERAEVILYPDEK